MRRTLLGGVCLVLLGCGPAAASCPARFESRPELDAQLFALLEGDPVAAKLERETRGARTICRGPIEDGALAPGGVVLLPENAEPATAARFVHLLVHRRDGLAELHGLSREDCLARVYASETEAWLTEFELRARLELAPASAFETELRAVGAEQRGARVEAWLEAEGAPTWTREHYEGRCTS